MKLYENDPVLEPLKAMLLEHFYEGRENIARDIQRGINEIVLLRNRLAKRKPVTKKVKHD